MQINQWFRKHQKKFFVGIGVLIMAAWYVLPAMERTLTRSRDTGGTIFGKKISERDVQEMAYRILALMPRARLRNLQTHEIRAAAWQWLILLHEADRLGIKATEEETAAFIRGRPEFAGPTGFDTTRYRAHLKQRQITERDYEKAAADAIRLGKLETFLRDGVKVTENEAWRWYEGNHEKVTVRYLELTAEKVAPLVDAPEAALRAFFEKRMNVFPEDDPHGAGYKIPEKVQIEYLLADVDRLAAEVVISERMIEDYYEANRDRYRLPTPPPPTGSGSEVAIPPATYRLLAEVAAEIEGRLRREEAKQLSAALIARADADLNGESGSVFLKTSEAEFARLTRSYPGIHRWQVVGPFIEVWADEPTREKLRAAYGGSQPVDFAALALKYPGMEHVTETPFFARSECDTILPGAYDLARDAFGKSPEDITADLREPRRPMQSQRGSFIYRLLAVQPPRAPAFEEEGIRARVEKDYRLAEGLKLAEQLMREAAGKSSLEEAAAFLETALATRAQPPAPALKAGAANNVPQSGAETPAAEPAAPKTQYQFVRLGTSRPFARPQEFRNMRLAYETGLSGNRPAFATKAFELKLGEIGIAVETSGERAVYLVQPLQRERPRPSDFALHKEETINAFMRVKQEAVWEAWLADVRRRANPSPNVKSVLSEWFAAQATP